MATNDREKLQAFAQKMHDEGAAGFASGLTPWDTWDDFEDRVGSRVWQGTAEQVAGREKPKSSFGDRVLTTMTALAVVTLIIGIIGVYVTEEPDLQIADNSVQLQLEIPSRMPKIPLPWKGKTDDAGKEVIVFNTVSTPVQETIPVDPGAPGIEMAGAPDQPAAAYPEGSPSAIAPGMDNHMALAPNDLPAPAAGIPAAAGTVNDPSTGIAPSEPALTAMNIQPGKTEETPAELVKTSPTQPTRLSRLNTQTINTEPSLPAQNLQNSKPASKSGDWSINLASYTRASTAEKMKGRFLDKGVAADQVTATVNGKTYFRLRVTGFESREAAMVQNTGIKEKLGLKETWITRQ